MSWEKIRLKDCCVSIADGDHQPAPKSEQGIKFIKIKDIRNNTISFSEALFVPVEYYRKLQSDRKPQRNDVLYSVVGSFGVSAFVNTDDSFCFERNIALLRSKNNVIPKFLYYAVSAPDFYNQANNAAIGAAQKLISLTRLKEMMIPYPPIKKQQRIADILSTYDDLIENNQKQIKLLEEAAQRLYKEWFIDLRFPGFEHTKIVDGVPEGWEEKSISSISSGLRRGISPKYNDQGTYTVINQKCIRQTVVSFDEARKQEKIYSEELNLQDSDTVICSTGAGTLGRVGQVFGNFNNTTFDSHVTLIRAKKEIGKQYLFQSLKFNQSYFTDMGKGSTNQLELSRETIQNLAVFTPTKDIINRFELLAQALHNRITLLSNEIIRLQESRDRLLPKLMSGEMKI